MGGPSRYCGQCGQQMKQGARFCGSCGRPVSNNLTSAPVTEEERAYGPVPGYAAAQDTAARQKPVTPAPASTEPARPPGTWSDDSAVGPAQERQVGSPGRQDPGYRTGRRRPSGWMIVAGLVVLTAVAGSVLGVVLTHHSRASLTATSHRRQTTRAAAPEPATTEPSPAPTPTPPAVLSLNGITIAVGAVNTDPDVTAVAQTLAKYFGGIDSGNYTQAWDTYTPALQAAIPFQPWSSDLSTTQDTRIVVQSIRHHANGNVDATVLFRSHQAPQDGPNPGETCTDWSLDYRLVPSSGSAGYLINKVKKAGAGDAPC